MDVKVYPEKLLICLNIAFQMKNKTESWIKPSNMWEKNSKRYSKLFCQASWKIAQYLRIGSILTETKEG